MLEACGYQELPHHKTLHAALLRKMERIRQDRDQMNDPRNLLDFLKKWWLEHINTQDKLYAPHLLAADKVRSV